MDQYNHINNDKKTAQQGQTKGKKKNQKYIIILHDVKILKRFTFKKIKKECLFSGFPPKWRWRKKNEHTQKTHFISVPSNKHSSQQPIKKKKKRHVEHTQKT